MRRILRVVGFGLLAVPAVAVTSLTVGLALAGRVQKNGEWSPRDVERFRQDMRAAARRASEAVAKQREWARVQQQENRVRAEEIRKQARENLREAVRGASEAAATQREWARSYRQANCARAEAFRREARRVAAEMSAQMSQVRSEMRQAAREMRQSLRPRYR